MLIFGADKIPSIAKSLAKGVNQVVVLKFSRQNHKQIVHIIGHDEVEKRAKNVPKSG